jgi:rhamnosyltransferase
MEKKSKTEVKAKAKINPKAKVKVKSKKNTKTVSGPERVAKGKNKKYTVGIAIRTWNEAEFLGRCIEMLKRQKSEYLESLEILVIDSYSTDGTIEISEREGCSLLEIPKEKFNYGGSLNSGIELLKKDLIISLSAHAIPQTEDFIHELIKPFNDPKVAGTYSRQEAWPDALFREKIRILQTFDNKPRTFTNPGDVDLHFSNVASCIRKSCWNKIRFQPIPSSEDIFWAEDMLKGGYSIIYVPAVCVYHSHKDSVTVFTRRFYNIMRNELVKREHSSMLQNIYVLKSAAWYVKYIIYICLTEKGSISEKLAAVGRSFVEFFIIIKYHFKHRS